MAKMVGLSRNIKLQWLNKVYELVSDGLNEEAIKEQLNEYLSFEITSPTNLRKKREILMNVWVYHNDFTDELRHDAIELIRKYPEYSVAIHWCMLLASYPVFSDLCKLIGKMSEFQDEIVLSQLKQKLFDEWGERTTLFHSIDKLIATLKALNVLQCNKPGKYHVKKENISNDNVVRFMLYSVMCIDDAGYYNVQDLQSFVYLFPFSYKVDKEALYDDNRFVIGNIGGEMSISISE